MMLKYLPATTVALIVLETCQADSPQAFKLYIFSGRGVIVAADQCATSFWLYLHPHSFTVYCQFWHF